MAVEGAAGHWDHREDDDYFSQPGDLFRLMDADQQQALFENTARSLGGVPEKNPAAAYQALSNGRPGLW